MKISSYCSIFISFHYRSDRKSPINVDKHSMALALALALVRLKLQLVLQIAGRSSENNEKRREHFALKRVREQRKRTKECITSDGNNWNTWKKGNQYGRWSKEFRLKAFWRAKCNFSCFIKLDTGFHGFTVSVSSNKYAFSLSVCVQSSNRIER